jgi:hypothetical protein
MERNWDVIREVLNEIASMTDAERSNLVYEVGPDATDADRTKVGHALLLHDHGFLTGFTSQVLDDDLRTLMQPNLTWEAHDLLATLRSKPVWEKVKSTAAEKGLDLTFDAVKYLGKAAYEWVINSG